MDGLKDAHREAITKVIAANDRVERAVLFGSRATGTNTVSSDVDIALFGKRLTLTDQACLDVALDEIPMAQSVDLLLYDSIQNRILREHIRQQGIEWYRRQRQIAERQPEVQTGNVVEWSERVLGELTDNFDSVRVPVKQADRVSGPYPYYGASGIVDHVDDYLLDGKYLLIAEDGENLRTRSTPIAFLAAGKFWVNNHAHVVRGNQKADTRFLMYALSKLDISGYLTGSTMPKLTQDSLNRICLWTPGLSEQRTIAHILGTLDDKMELSRRMNSTLDAMAWALYKSWFVDFDPVRAKMESRDTGLPKEIANLFPDRLVDSELGEVPESWAVGVLDDAVELLNGGTPRTSVAHYWNGDISWYTAKDAPAPHDVFVVETERTVTQAGVDNSATTVLPPRTTVISARGTVGRLACLGRSMAMNQTCYGIRGAGGYLTLYILACQKGRGRFTDPYAWHYFRYDYPPDVCSCRCCLAVSEHRECVRICGDADHGAHFKQLTPKPSDCGSPGRAASEAGLRRSAGEWAWAGECTRRKPGIGRNKRNLTEQ